MLIGVFDTGFWLGHDCFDHIVAREAVVADSDFVAGDSDPMRVPVPHGAQVMSLIGGYDPGYLVGCAWDAQFILARTENTSTERHVEEDNWAAALVWAESLGVGIVNSSLSYRTGFTPPDTDYTYADMDGRTTIIAQAVRGALERGVVVVNAMGNDGDAGGSVTSPGDSPDVVSVGAVDANGAIAGYSSRGPTADGRMKPDLVAMGSNVLIPGIRSNSYTHLSGTSFASPLVAGALALAWQCHPHLSPQDAVAHLYGTCRLAPGQDSIDNVYGRGIPNALLGCLREQEFFVVAEDSLGRRVLELILVSSDGNEVVRADSCGTILTELETVSLPMTLRAGVEGGPSQQITIDSLPAYRVLRFEPQRELVLTVLSVEGQPVTGADVRLRAGSSDFFYHAASDSAGIAVLPLYGLGWLDIEVGAPEFRTADTIIQRCDSQACSATVVLEPVVANRFLLYPNVVSRSGHDGAISVEFIVDHGVNPHPFVASVRTIAGELVWQTQGTTPTRVPLRLTYDCRNRAQRRLIPGTYVFVIECDGRAHMKKFMITG